MYLSGTNFDHYKVFWVEVVIICVVIKNYDFTTKSKGMSFSRIFFTIYVDKSNFKM